MSRRLAHWQRGWGVAEGRFAVWVGCALRSGGWLGPRGTWFGCPHTVRELLGPRHQVPPARARGKTWCGVSRRVVRGCWEGPISPPDPQACPVPALPPFPQPHRHPWAGVFEARWRANLCASSSHPPPRWCLQHDQLQQAIKLRRDLYEKQRPVSRSWLAGCDDGAPRS